MAKYFISRDKNTSAHRVSDGGMARQDPFYQQSREENKIINLTDRANSWLKNSASYFGVDKDEYTSEYFGRRKSEAEELKSQGADLLKEIETSYGAESDFAKEFKGYYDELSNGFDGVGEYYSQNPYFVQYASMNLPDLEDEKKNIGDIYAPMRDPFNKDAILDFDFNEYTLKKKGLDDAELYLMSQDAETFASPQSARNKAMALRHTNPKAEEYEYNKRYATYLENYADKLEESGAYYEAVDYDRKLEALSGIKTATRNAKQVPNAVGGMSYETIEDAYNNEDVFRFFNGLVGDYGHNWFESEKVTDSVYWKTELANTAENRLVQIYKDVLSSEDFKDWYLSDRINRSGSADNFISTMFHYFRPDEAMVYGYLKDRGGPLFEEYKTRLEPVLTARSQRAAYEDYEYIVKENPVLASIASGGLKFAGGFLGLGKSIANTIEGKPTDANDAYFSASSGANAIRETVKSEYIPDETGKFLYDVGMSVEDSAIAALFGAGAGYAFGGAAASTELVKNITSTATSVIQGSQVATDAFVDGKIKGYSNEKALSFGIVRGIVEALTEKYSIDTILNADGTLLKRIAKSAIAEGSEEVASNWINNVVDVLADGENIITRKMAEYRAKNPNATVGDALTYAIVGSLGEDLKAFVAGGLSGIAMGGTFEAAGVAMNANKYSNLDAVSINKMVINGLSQPESSQAYKLASAMNVKISDVYDAALEEGYTSEQALEKAVAAISKRDVKNLGNAIDAQNRNNKKSKEVAEVGAENVFEQQAQDAEEDAVEYDDELSFGDEYSEGSEAAAEVNAPAAENASEVYEGGMQTEYDDELSFGDEYSEGSEVAAEVDAPAAENASEVYEGDMQTEYDDELSFGDLYQDDKQQENAAVSRENPKGVAAKRLSDSKTVGVVGVEYSDAEGNITYRLNNGEVVEAENIQFDDDFESYVLSDVAKGFETDSANAIVRAAVEYKEYAKNNGAMASSQKLRSSFNDLRAAGLKGVTYEQAARDIKLSGDIRQIGESAARIAINDGLYMAEGVSRTKTKPAVDGKKKSADKSRTANTKVRPKKGAVTVSEDVKVSKSMKGDIEVLNRIAEVGDVAVVIEKFEGADKDAKGFYSKGVIHLNADKLSEGGFTYTGIHESVHYLAEVNPEGYAAIEKFLKNYYKQQGVDLESQIELTQAIYSKRGVELTPEGAMEEIVCNTLSDIATDKKALSAFLKLSKKEQKSFVDFIRDIAKRLKAWADKNLKGSKYHSVIVKDAKTLRELAGVFNTELTKSAQKNNTAESSGVKYHAQQSRINPAYLDAKTVTEKDVEALINGAVDGKYNDKDYVPIRISTPGIIQERLFVDDLPMVMPVKKIIQALKVDDGIQKGNNQRGHGFSVTDIINIVKKLDEPNYLFSQPANNRGVAVVEYSSNSNSTVVIVEFDCNINPAYLSGYEGGTYNLAISSFDVDGGMVGLYEYAKRNNWIEVFNKEKEGNPAKKFPTIKPFAIEQDSLNNSISNDDKNVNKKSIASTDAEYLSAVESGDMETAQRLVDEAADAAMKESKIRDESGNLVKVYHGSDSADFYEFDKARRGQTDTSMYGRGYYFAFDPDYASDFGENIREFYLDIKNPFYIDINAPSKVIAEFLESKGIEVNISDRYKQSHYFAKMFGSQKFTDTLVDLGFDGVIVRTDEGDYWETVAFHRNQMKLADAVTYDNDGNVIPVSERFSEKRDMRYSFGEEDLDFGLYLNENSEVAENLKESGRAVGAIFEKTKGAEVDIFDVSKVMKKNLRDFGIKGETIDANERILEVIELASAEGYVDGSEVVGEIAAVMKDTLRNSPYVVDNFKEEREDILSRMKGIGKIYLSEDQIAMLEDSDYSLNRFKQKMFGKITVVNKPKTAGNVESLNTLWHSLSEAYPEWFSAETLSDNMPMEMLRVMDELKPQSVGADDFFMQSNDEIAIELASRVVSDIVDVKYRKLQDNKVKSEVKKLKEKQSESMKKWLLKKDAGEKLKSIEKYAAGFYKKLIKPSKNDSIPEVLRKPLLEMLEGLNFSKGTLYHGEAIKHDKIWQVRMKVVAEALMNYGGLTMNPETKDITLEGDAVRGFEVDARLIADLNELAESGAKDVYKMSDEELLKLNGLMYRLRNEVSQLNKLNANKFKANVQELGQATISELDNKGENKLLKSRANNVLFYSTADALTYFSQYGEAGMSVYEELREGYDKYILNIDKVRKFSEKNLDEKKIRQWSKESFDFTLESGDKVSMTVPQLMTLYLLDKRKQARGHLYENADGRGKISVEDKKGNKKRAIISNNDVILMTAKLTDEQVKCAQKMQWFLESEAAEWGNEVTMRRYLYRAFTVKDYFPIKVDGVSVDTTDATASMASFYAVANPGFSKQTQEGAHKPLIIGDVFDVFTEHCGNMAMFNGMSEALSDAMRWYNFRSGDSSVKESIENSMSKDGLKWFETFIQDLNGRGQRAEGADKVVKKMVATTKSALIWGNMKVVAQQPTAYLRALNVLDIKYLADPRVLKKGGVEKAMKYCPTAMYKSWGFYTTDVGKSARNLVLNTDTVYDKVKNFGFKAAGFADEITWGRLWNACELQIKDKNKNLEVGSEEFYQEVAKLLRQVIDETQVVDTPFHRSQIRRNPSATSQVMSAFMDEPIKAYNMFMRAIQSGDAKKIARAAAAYTTTVVLGQSLVKAVYDLLFRFKADEDDDGEKGWDDFLELYGKSVFDEMNPLNLHPILSKFSGVGETILHNTFPESPLFSDSSFGSGSLDSTVITDLTNMFSRIIKGIRGESEDRTWYGYAYDISKVVSDVSGIGVNRVLQDVVGIVNNFLPANAKVTKTDYSNSAVAELAVDALLKGNKGDYDMWYKELEERFKGDKDKIQSKLASALGKSSDKRVSAMLDALESGDKETIDAMYDELEGLGFDNDVIVKGTKSYKAKYESYVNKAAQANVDGDSAAYDEAIAWIKEQGVFDEVYLDDIAEKVEKLCTDQSSDDVEELYDNTVMVIALKNYGEQYFNEMLSERLESKNDAEKEKTRNSLKTAVSKEFKLSFCEAFCNENAEKVEKIEGYLISSGLYADDSDSLWEDTTKDWVKTYIRDAYKSAYSLEDVEECTRLINLLYKSGVYANKKNADKALESWRNEEK